MTTQTPAWRDQSTAGNPSGDRATPGTLVGGRYELRIAIGNGGMGTVWRATDTVLRREVAVKEVILPPTMPRNEQDALCERTLREARAAAALSHPSVVQVYDVVTDSARPWIVMELLDARSLADMVIDDGPLSQREVAKIGIAMLGALEVAHAAGVLHRDVKPANVLVCADGRCVLTDFGVARLPTESKLTTPGMVLGSPHFISPERAVGGSFGPPSDLFSLGVTLYTAVEGGPPFDRGDPFETMRAVVEEAPRPPRLAGPLQPILMGLLDKDPARRWSVDQARSTLRELLTGQLSRPGRAHTDGETDPQAVTLPPSAIRERRTGPQVGGRAMLDPDEPLTGQLARLRDSAGQRTVDGGAGQERIDGDLPDGDWSEDDWREDDWREDDRREDDRRDGDRREREWREGDWPGGEGEWREGDGQRRDAAREPRRDGVGRRRARSSSSIMAEQVRDRVRAVGGRAVNSVRSSGVRSSGLSSGAGSSSGGSSTGVRSSGGASYGLRSSTGRAIGAGTREPNTRNRLIAVAGLVLVLVAALGVAALSGAFSAATPTPTPLGSASVAPSTEATPLIAVQEFRDSRGIVVNVPEGWTRTGSSYIDFTDPAGGRKIRINVETASGTAEKFFTSAESGLKKPSICPSPYKRVDLRAVTLAGRDGAELEYTCGSGDAMRHGIWQAVVVEGKAYHFYLTVPDARFADSKVIFDEMVRSFQLV